MDKEIKIKSVSFTEKDMDMYEYAQTKDNFSKYVIALMRKDKNHQLSLDYDKIRELIKEEVAKVIKISPEVPNKDNSEDIIDAVKGLFD